MGWTTSTEFNRRDDFKAFIADRTRDQGAVSFKDGEPTGGFHCLKHCVRGNILWSVWELTKNNGETKRFIGCDIVKYYGQYEGWGYKDMDESCGPYYYSCPKSYLEMTPVANQEWRDKVMAGHNLYKAIKVGVKVNLTNGNVATIVSKRPLWGSIDGVTYRIPRKMISEIQEPQKETEKVEVCA